MLIQLPLKSAKKTPLALVEVGQRPHWECRKMQWERALSDETQAPLSCPRHLWKYLSVEKYHKAKLYLPGMILETDFKAHGFLNYFLRSIVSVGLDWFETLWQETAYFKQRTCTYKTKLASFMHLGLEYWTLINMYKFWAFFAIQRDIKGNVNGRCAGFILFWSSWRCIRQTCLQTYL